MLSLPVHKPNQGTVTLEFEHSLLSVSKWEDKYGKAFLTNLTKSSLELIDYFGMMLTSPEHDPDDVLRLSHEQQEALVKYMNSTPGATVAPPKEDGARRRNVETKSAEIIYMEMVLLKIPWEAKHWHINKLMMLIAWTAHKQAPPKKEKRGNLLKSWVSDNDRNKKFFGSNG